MQSCQLKNCTTLYEPYLLVLRKVKLLLIGVIGLLSRKILKHKTKNRMKLVLIT